MDANRLRRLAAEVDKEHRAAMRHVDADVADRDLGRRQIVRGLGGVALTVGGVGLVISALATAAGAQESTTTTSAGDSTSSIAATTTTTLPPAKPQPADLVLLSFAQSIELAVVRIYDLAIGGGLLSGASAKVATAFRTHHRDHAQAFAGIAGKAAKGVANQSLVSAFSPRLQAATSERDVLHAAFTLEMAAASTYTAALAKIEGTDPAYLVASILPIESRHAVVLGEALDLNVDAYTPAFESTADALTPAQYPIVEA